MDIADPDRFEAAIKAFRKKVPVTDAEFETLTAELQDLAFTVANVSQADIVEQVYQAIDSAIANGTTLEAFKAEVEESLTAQWGEENPSRLELIFHQNVMQAYSDGRDELLNNEAVKESHPYLRFDAIMDDRTSEICESLDGTILPADDPFWNTHRPLLHFFCRSVLTPVNEEDAQAEGIAKEAPETKADSGFGTPAKDWKPDPDDYSDEIKGILERRLAQ